MGVDPGKSGGVAVLLPGFDWMIHQFTTDGDLVDFFREVTAVVQMNGYHITATMEEVNAMPSGAGKMGATSAFSFGRNFGFYHGLLLGMDIGYKTVRPQVWQKILGLHSRATSGGAKEHKDYLAEEARRRFPSVFSGKTKGWTKAVCDAVLLAEYARTTFTEPLPF